MNAAMIPSTRDSLEQANVIPPLVAMLASKEEENMTHAITGNFNQTVHLLLPPLLFLRLLLLNSLLIIVT
jgi:hypothetical protein